MREHLQGNPRSTRHMQVALFPVLLLLGGLFARAYGEGDSPAAVKAFDLTPAVFVENKGQWGEGIRYGFHGKGGNVVFTDSGPVFQLVKGEGRSTKDTAPQAVFSVKFPGAKEVSPEGLEPSATKTNYFIGNDESKWRTDVPAAKKLAYLNLYDGVDLYVSGKRSGLKYEFHMAAGASWEEIQIEYEGIEGLHLDDKGVLHVMTAVGEIVDEAPVAWQETDQGRRAVAVRYRLLSENSYGFEIEGQVDAWLGLVIDPDLTWGTYLGGSDTENTYICRTDGQGNSWVVGTTESTDFPIRGGIDTYGDLLDVFVAKVSSEGALLCASYLGGWQPEYPYNAVLDTEGNIIIGGATWSSDFPTTQGLNYGHGAFGFKDIFFAKVTSSGHLAWGGALGGTKDEPSDNASYGMPLCVDAEGNVFIVTLTRSTDMPTPNGFDRSNTPFLYHTDELAVAKISADGRLKWASYLGGEMDEQKPTALLTADGDLVLAGQTDSSDFPVCNAFDPTFDASWGSDRPDDASAEMFVAKVTSNGKLSWASYLGGLHGSEIWDMAMDSQGNIWVAGVGRVEDYSHGEEYNRYYGPAGTSALAVSKITTAGRLVGVTQIGHGNALGDPCSIDYWRMLETTPAEGGAVYVGDSVGVSDLPAVNSFDGDYNGGGDVWLAKLNLDGQLLWSSYLGGSGGETLEGLQPDNEGNVFVIGETYSEDFPTPNGFQGIYGGEADVFVAKFSVTGALEWASYLGGDRGDILGPHEYYVPAYFNRHYVVDASGGLFLTGCTRSSNLPTPNGFLTANPGEPSAFVAEITASGELKWSSYFGGSGADDIFSISLDADGNALIVGQTSSPDIVMSGGFQPAYAGIEDAFIAKIGCGRRYIRTETLRGGVVRVPYEDTVEAVNPSRPYTWSIAQGNLPPGLSLDALSGVISGVPTQQGRWDFDVRLNDSGNQPQCDDKTLFIIVIEDNEAPVVSSLAAVPTVIREYVDRQLTVTALVDDRGRGDLTITNAECFIGAVGAAGSGTPLLPADGAFNSPVEAVVGTVETSAWRAPDTYTMSVRGRDLAQNWGPVESIDVEVVDGTAPAAMNDLRLTQVVKWDKIASEAWGVSGLDTDDAVTKTIDLGALKIIGGVSLTPAKNLARFPTQFSIRASEDGDSWVLLADEILYTATRGTHLWTTEPVEYRYVKVEATPLLDRGEGKYCLEMAEVAVYETLQRNYARAAWTAVADNDTDPLSSAASVYDMRYGFSRINSVNFASCATVTDVPEPAAPGQAEDVVFGIPLEPRWLFAAMKVGDEVVNWSGLSNVASLRTWGMGLRPIWPDDQIVFAASPKTVFTYTLGQDVRGVRTAFNDEPHFPRMAYEKGDGTRAAPLRFATHKGGWGWKPTNGQWARIKKLVPEGGTVYWRLEGRSRDYVRINGPVRAIVFETGDISGLCVEPKHEVGGEDAMWPDIASPPTFSWTDDTQAMAAFFVDVSTDEDVPLGDKKQTTVLGGRGTSASFYTATRAEWQKVRQVGTVGCGTLYWRARAQDADKALTVASAAKKLIVDGGEWTVSPLDLSSPTPTVTWTHVGEGIVKYGLEFSVDDTFAPTANRTLKVPSKTLTVTSYMLTPAEVAKLKNFAARNGVAQLYYRVRGEDADRAFVTYSDAQTAAVP